MDLIEMKSLLSPNGVYAIVPWPFKSRWRICHLTFQAQMVYMPLDFSSPNGIYATRLSNLNGVCDRFFIYAHTLMFYIFYAIWLLIENCLDYWISEVSRIFSTFQRLHTTCTFSLCLPPKIAYNNDMFFERHFRIG
jgi:hypothetical protein